MGHEREVFRTGVRADTGTTPIHPGNDIYKPLDKRGPGINHPRDRRGRRSARRFDRRAAKCAHR